MSAAWPRGRPSACSSSTDPPKCPKRPPVSGKENTLCCDRATHLRDDVPPRPTTGTPRRATRRESRIADCMPRPHIFAPLRVMRRRPDHRLRMRTVHIPAEGVELVYVHPESARVAAHFVQRYQSVVTVERRILDSLRHRRTGELLEPKHELRLQRTRSIPASDTFCRKSNSSSSKSGRRCFAAAIGRLDVLHIGVMASPRNRHAHKSGTRGSTQSLLARLDEYRGACSRDDSGRSRRSGKTSAVSRFTSLPSTSRMTSIFLACATSA